eukprot:3810644-Lingulodinium_polyedra.AAC.1
MEFVLRNPRPANYDAVPGLGHPRELPGDLDKLLQVTYAIAEIRDLAPAGNLTISGFPTGAHS